ncbi:hypothetical protein [Alkalibacillus almallahensis]|uniref:hypothetical protein n=1 Tax=Alkalibacillus almallahensis TaxID=1379154 RepID=UPI00141D9C16|nr:hypothetical protein [Alkalibacillus almallahensis]NIK10876.1 hypothetical protein [Alkalibacillus almallahensis]
MITTFLGGAQKVDIEAEQNRILFKVMDNKTNTVMFSVPIEKAEHFMKAFNAEYQMAVGPSEKEGELNEEDI